MAKMAETPSLEQRLILHNDLKDFAENTLLTDKRKVELFGKFLPYYIWYETNTAFHKKNIIPTNKHGGGMQLLCCFRMTCCS